MEPADSPPAFHAPAAQDYGPRADERELCDRAAHTDWLYLGALIAMNVGAVALDTGYLKYNESKSAALRLAGPALSGLTFGALVGGTYASLPKCDPGWVTAHPAEGAVRSDTAIVISMSLLSIATAPLFVGIYTGIIPRDWPVTERSMRVVLPMGTGLIGSLLPRISFLAPKTLRSSRELEQIRLQASPLPSAEGSVSGVQLGLTGRF